MQNTAQGVLAFWLEAGEENWFNGGPEFDKLCCERYLDLHFSAARAELASWAGEPDGSLALVLLLDQFPRHLFRGSAHAYATDPLARSVADSAIAARFDLKFTPELRSFFYLPFMHSEDLADQLRASQFFQTLDTPRAAKWSEHHLQIIQRFGRFPHRNGVLGRRTTPEEKIWLEAGGFRG